jgi:uncharacterized protein YuzE
MKNIRKLEGSGVVDYDFVNDILFFKVDKREYSHSIELLGYVVDLDIEGFVVGLQIFNASNQFGISKNALRVIKSWKFEASLIEDVLEVKVFFNMIQRNKIIEKNPILVQKMGENLPNSTVLCRV